MLEFCHRWFLQQCVSIKEPYFASIFLFVASNKNEMCKRVFVSQDVGEELVHFRPAHSMMVGKVQFMDFRKMSHNLLKMLHRITLPAMATRKEKVDISKFDG